MGDYSHAFMRNNPNIQASVKAQNRANVLEQKRMAQGHPTGLTAHLLKLFDPEYAPPLPEVETPAQRRARIHKLRLEKGAKKAAEELEKYDPSSDPNVTGDPYKTLFVSRLNYETTESRVKREFEAFGPIKQVRLVMDKNTNKPRGYAFVEYVHTRDMKAAYKQADGKKIDNRRVLVDVERGRTVPNWRPRRLGGGLGTIRVGNEDVTRGVVQIGRAASQPRVRDDRDRDMEKSRGRGRERETSGERSHDRPRKRDHRDDRHHRERERTKERDGDRGQDRTHDRERDREWGKDRNRDHEHDRDRGHQDRDRGRDRHRERDRERGRDHEGDGVDHGGRRSRDMEYGYEHVDSKHEWGRHAEPEDDHEQNDYHDHHQRLGDYENPGVQGGDDHYKEPTGGHDHYDKMEVDN